MIGSNKINRAAYFTIGGGNTSGDNGDARESVADDQNAGANWNDSFLRTSGIVNVY